MIYTRGSTSAALSKQGSGPGGSEGQRSSSTAVTSVQGGAGGHADDHTMEIDQVSDGKYIYPSKGQFFDLGLGVFR